MVRNVEQRPVLFAFVRELLEREHVQEFAASLPARARVSEPALPLLVCSCRWENANENCFWVCV